MTGRAAGLTDRKMAYLFGAAALLIIISDLVTKWAAFRFLDPQAPLTVIPGFLNLQLSLNEGAVFGLGKGLRPLFVVFALVASAGIVWAQWVHGRSSLVLTGGLALLLGGALGNLYDRIADGCVRDFIDVYAGSYHWPTFNIADTAICIGCGLVILYSFRAPSPDKAAPSR